MKKGTIFETALWRKVADNDDLKEIEQFLTEKLILRLLLSLDPEEKNVMNHISTYTSEATVGEPLDYSWTATLLQYIVHSVKPLEGFYKKGEFSKKIPLGSIRATTSIADSDQLDEMIKRIGLRWKSLVDIKLVIEPSKENRGSEYFLEVKLFWLTGENNG